MSHENIQSGSKSEGVVAKKRSGGFIAQSELEFRSAELVLKITKEIVIKFIEAGRLSLSSFDSAFQIVHASVIDACNVTIHKHVQD